MKERTTFEMRLETMFGGYADRAPVEVDAAGLAGQIAAARPRRAYDRMTARNRWLVPALIGLMLIATLAATVYVAAQLLTPRVIGYDEHFAIAADISDPRPNPIAVALADGRVVISTGWDGDGGADQVHSQIYDPETGESEALSGVKPYGGDGAGIRLADGRVLLLMFSMNTTSSRAYLVDPATSSVRELDQPGDSNAPPFGVLPSMALLKDGRVLIAGGQSDVFTLDMLATAVLFDPVTESFIPTGSMSEPRTNHSMITLRDGRVLAVGGDLAMDHGSIGDSTGSTHLISSAEIYDPSTGQFASTGGLTNFAGRAFGVLLTDGRVAVMPEYIPDPMGNPEPSTPTSIEIYDPRTATFGVAGSTLRHPDAAFALRDGRVLLTGSAVVPMNMVGPGEYWERSATWALVFDPATGEFEPTPPPRAEHSGSTVLPDGRVLFAGGMAYPPADENGNGTGEAFPVPWVDIFE